MNSNFSFPKAFLFDFDGVVVDSFDSHYNAWKTAYKEIFEKEIPPFPHEKLSGKSPLLIAEYFCQAAGDISKTQEFFDLKAKHLHQITVPPKLLPGVYEIRNFLTTEKIPFGIASNATRTFIGNSISQLDLGFDTYLGIEDYKHPKPNPEAYISLAKLLTIKTKDFQNVWVFEDSITGTKAAKEAGMIPIGILTMNSKQEMKAAGSQFFFPTLLEAFAFLRERNN